MEDHQFDALARNVRGAGASRRQVMRTVAAAFLGGAPGGLAARLGLSEAAAATRKPMPRHHRQRKNHGALQSEGKGKRKQKNKKRHHQPQPPQDPIPCPNYCTDRGGRCCPDGSCLDPYMGGYASCCAGERHCEADNSCIADGQCCPGETTCEGGSCLSEGCCPEMRECPDSCVLPDECCPGQKRCGGNCLPADICCDEDPYPVCSACEEVVCASGAWRCHSTGHAVCQQGCCPEGYECNHLGSCCTDSPTFHCTCPSGYCARNGLCVTTCT